MRNNYILFFLFLFTPALSFATHLRAGEITATRISNTQLTYKISLITYTDEINGKPVNDNEHYVDFNFGFSTSRIEMLRVHRKEKKLINRATVRNVYDTTYTFPGPGYYTIGVGIVNRNANTLNLPAGSENISFFVQTSILINANIGFNSTPVLLNIPIDSAAVGQRFIHNPGAFDIDGDSLSYKLTIPRKDQGNETGIGVFIDGYVGPNTIGTSPVLNQAGTGPASFTIDPRTGDLVWDVPRRPGQYNVAFVVEEWRKGFDGNYIKIGEIVRDMQIFVVETENVPPQLTVPNDICIEAGETVEFEIVGQDANISQTVKLTTSGGVYNIDPGGNIVQFVAPEPAKFTTKPSAGKATGRFEWNTNCLHAREQPYNVVFKAEDEPGRFNTQLVDIKSVNIRVLPPRTKGLVAQELATGNMLSWQQLTVCGTNGKILVYRKSGCSGLNPGECTSGIPVSWGYQLIGEVTTKDTAYLDTKVENGEIYSYRLVTEITENAFINIRSSPSIEFCVGSEIKPGTSIMTRVSVLETSPTSGKMDVRWSKPVGIDLQTLTGPLVYKLDRAEGIGGETFTLVHTKETTFADSTDTHFIDQNLNTDALVYRYKVEFYTASNILNSISSPASSVRLNTRTSDKALVLSWEANTPWVNENNTHYIYRQDPSDPSKYNLVKKLDVTNAGSYTFTDTGVDAETEDGNISMELINGDTYCYKVLTYGEYEAFKDLGRLPNFSQIKCAVPLDPSPPCTPAINISGSLTCEQLNSEDFCDEQSFSNIITWTNPTTVVNQTCRNDVISYSIYYSRYEDTDPVLLATIQAGQTNTFTHRKNRKEGFAGCYYVKARNSLGLESGFSERICFDNCDKLSFPNVFSPDGDGKNDTFTPMNCAAFINEAQIEIYSAHGQRVRSITSDTIEWDGKDNSGRDLPGGTYYYTIKVTLERINRAGSSHEFKGIVTLIRK